MGLPVWSRRDAARSGGMSTRARACCSFRFMVPGSRLRLTRPAVPCPLFVVCFPLDAPERRLPRDGRALRGMKAKTSAIHALVAMRAPGTR